MDGDTLFGYLIRLSPNGGDGLNFPVLERSVLIGRNGECDIRLKNTGISERHCKIQVSQLEKVTVHCLDPDYPVYVNEKEINNDGHQLQEGDIIKLADLSFRWQKNSISEPEKISKNAAHLSFCYDSASKVTPQKRQSAPGALLEDDTVEFNYLPENCGTIMPEKPVKEDLTSKNEIDANKEEFGNVSTKIDSEEDSFSDALGTEEVSTSLEDDLISEISEHQNTIEPDISSSTFCCNTPSKTAKNLSLAENKSMTRNNQTKDDDEDDVHFEDSASNLDENFDLNNEETQDLMLTTGDSSYFDENVSRKDNTTSFVDNQNERANTSNIMTAQLVEQMECPTPLLRSRRKSQKGPTPQRDTTVLDVKNSEDIFNSTDSTLTTSNIMKQNHSTPPRDDSIIEDVQNSILKTPKCFEEAYHSTPNKLCKEEPSNIPLKSLTESTPEVVESPGKFRYRRSTGIGTQVGTPSEEYRCKRSILTPAIRQSRDSTLKETEISAKVLPRRRSSERKSTPIKTRFSDRSMMRESIVPSPIIEDEASEKCEESQNESLTTDPKFKNVQMRRQRRFRGSSFANEKILEESETTLNDMTDGQLDDLNEEEEEDKSLMALSSCDDSVQPMSARIIINGDRSGNDNEENSELNSTFTIDSTEVPKEDSCTKEVPSLKSILTPLPKAPLSVREKSVKKVTFAHSVVEEAYEQSSLADSQFVDSSYTLGSQQSSFNSFDASETSSNLYSKIEEGLESFCENEELLISQRSQSSIFSHNSSSTPVKLSNNTPVSSEKLKGVTRCLNEWDKSFESSRTRHDSKNEQSLTACLTDISMDDNVDLTALQDAENKNRVSSNKTIEQSMNSTREITDEFVTPSESKLIDSIDDCSETKEPHSELHSRNFASTPMNATKIIVEDEHDSETFVSFADLLKTPCAVSSKLNKTIENKVDNSQMERSKSSTGVTPQLEQLRLNRTLNNTFGTPFVKSNESGISTKGTPCLKLNDATTSTPNYETNASLTPNMKVDKNAGSFVRTPLPKLSRTGTPHPKVSRGADSLKDLLDWKFNRSINVNMTANKSKLSNIDKSLKSTVNTPCQNSLNLDKTSNSAKCSTYSKQNSLNKTSDRSVDIHRSVVNSDETVHNLEDIAELQESPEATSLEEEYQLSIKTSGGEEEDLPGDESSTGIDLMITKSPEETPGLETSNNSQSGSESEVFEDAVTQDIFEEKAIEEAETQVVAPIDNCEFEALEEIDTQYASSLEMETQRDVTNELEALEDADTQCSFNNEREIIEEAETQAVEISELSVNDILQEAETQDLETDRVLVNDILEEAETQALEMNVVSVNDISEEAETQDLEMDGVPVNDILEEAETQALETDGVSVNNILEEAETQALETDGVSINDSLEEAETQALETDEVSVNQILEEAETQDILEFDDLEEAETQVVAENATTGRVSELKTLEEPELNIDTGANSPDIFDGEVIEEADTQDTVDEAIEDADTQDASEFCPVEEAETQAISESEIVKDDDSQNNSINEAIEEAETQFNLEKETEESPIEEIATQSDFEGPAVQDVTLETTTQDVGAVQVSTEETPAQNFVKKTSVLSGLESCHKNSLPKITIEEATPDTSYIKTQNIVKDAMRSEALEEAETQNIFDDATRQEAVEEAETQDIVMEGTEEEVLEVTEQITENKDLEESETEPMEVDRTTEASILEDVSKSNIVETVTELADTKNQSIVMNKSKSSKTKKSAPKSIFESTSDISNVIPAGVREEQENMKEILDTSERPISVADTTFQVEESKVQKRVSNIETVKEQRKPIPRSSQFGIPLSPTESPALRRSHRISHTENSTRVSRSIVAAELKPTRSSSRRTPMKLLEIDSEKSASKKIWKDRDNQENELRVNPFHRECSFCDSSPARKSLRNNNEGTPARKPARTPLRKTERKSTLKKSEVQEMDSNQKMTTRKSSPLQNAKLSTGNKRRALIKLDSNTEIIQTPSKTARSTLNDSISPVSIVLPVLRVSSTEIGNTVHTLQSTVKVNEDQVSSKPKRTSKRGKDLHSEIDVKVKSPDTSIRARKQKDSAEFNTMVLPSKEQTNKRGRKKTSSVITSPASTTSSIVGSPKRAARKRRLEMDEASSGASPAKRALRGRKIATPVEEIPSRPKRANRGSQEKLDECVTETKSKRAKTVVDMASVSVESTQSAVEVKRTNRPKRNADVMEETAAPKKKPTTRSNRQKTSQVIEGPSTSKRGVKNRQPVVAEIEEECEPDDEVVVKEAPASRRGARNRQAVVAENEAKGKSNGETVVKELPAGRRGIRSRRAVEAETKAKSESDSEVEVKEVPTGRRGAKTRRAVETETKAKSESDGEAVVKEVPAGRRGARNLRTAVVETESNNARSIRGKRAAPVKETKSKRPAQEVVKNEVEEDEIATLPDRIKANRRSVSLANTEDHVKKSTRSRTTRPIVVDESTSTTVRSTRSKKIVTKGNARGPSLTVARKSLQLKVVKKHSSTTEDNSDEPRSKRVRICEPVEEVNKKPTKATIKRRETTTTKITKSDGSRSTTRRSCLKKTTVVKSPATEISARTTRGAGTKTRNSTTTSRTTRRK